MIEPDIDDTHLCIKCSLTIDGLENYIRHRKHDCRNRNIPHLVNKCTTTNAAEPSHAIAPTIVHVPSRGNLTHGFQTFSFAEPEAPSVYASKSEEGGKTAKSLSDPYYLPYELGADVFFSSLQLQSVQSSSGPSTSGKTSSTQQSLQRQKSIPEHTEVVWIESAAGDSEQHSTENLIKAVNNMNDSKKAYDVLFKPLNFVHESLEPSEDEEEEVDVRIEDEEEDEFETASSPHVSGVKWKPTLMEHSPPVVPVTHTGGKWKPENRPNLRITHTELSRLPSNWEESPEDQDQEHPPAGHTKGKWVPGSKLQHLDYKEEVEQKLSTAEHYWCKICCRKLKNKHLYENHMKTSYHLKRAEPEQQLERADLGDMGKNFVLDEPKITSTTVTKKRKRRAYLVKCELCRLTLSRHMLGKHLISHYHFRRMKLNPGKSLRMILENMSAIVRQAPFQCRPCSFYANTEETFLLHWDSSQHLNSTKKIGKLWCSFCRFECEDNNHMRRHLLGSEHKEVILAINRSVPICISRKLSINCPKCCMMFHYNAELRRHLVQNHPGLRESSTASDSYQSRFNCEVCSEVLVSKIALQRHKKYEHSILRYFCTICDLEFDSPGKAKRHRKTQEHRLHSQEKRGLMEKKVVSLPCKENCDFNTPNEMGVIINRPNPDDTECTEESEHPSGGSPSKQTAFPGQKKNALLNRKRLESVEGLKDLTDLEENPKAAHSLLSHVCMICGHSFPNAQALGRHTRICRPKVTGESMQTTLIKAQQDNEGRGKSSDTSKSWNCEECNFHAPLKSELLFHQLHHTLGAIGKNQMINCPLCRKSFRKHSLRCHLRQHTNERIFDCNFCEQKFARLHNLKSHIKVLHSEKPAQQPGTKKAFGTTYARKTSRQKLTEEPGGQCDLCGKVFSKKYALKQHIRTHHDNPRRCVCPLAGCSYAAASNSVLKVHLNSHSQESLRCQHAKCCYVGKSSMHLKRHSQSHCEPNKIFSCEKCGFKTKTSGHLKRHLRSHTGEKPYKCPHCAFKTAASDNLRKHILKTNKHPEIKNYCLDNKK